MTDLVSFLTARLDEEEQTARLARFSPRERWEAIAGGFADTEDNKIIVKGSQHVGEIARLPQMNRASWWRMLHIASYEPARVLTEIDAKRRSIEQHHRSGVACPRCSLGTEDGQVVFELDPCETLRLLALPYAEHPEYRPEWAPDVG